MGTLGQLPQIRPWWEMRLPLRRAGSIQFMSERGQCSAIARAFPIFLLAYSPALRPGLAQSQKVCKKLCFSWHPQYRLMLLRAAAQTSESHQEVPPSFPSSRALSSWVRWSFLLRWVSCQYLCVRWSTADAFQAEFLKAIERKRAVSPYVVIVGFWSLLFPWSHSSFSAFKLAGEGSESCIKWVHVD